VAALERRPGATWTQVGLPHGATAFYGDQGTIEFRPEGLWLGTRKDEKGSIIENLPDPGHGRSLMEHMLRQLDRGEPVAEFVGVRRGRGADWPTRVCWSGAA